MTLISCLSRACGEREVLEETGVRCRAQTQGIWAFDVPVSRELQYVVVDVLAEWVDGEPRAADDALDAAFVTQERFLSLGQLVHPATRELVLHRLRVFQ